MHPRAMLQRVGDKRDFKQVDGFQHPARASPAAAPGTLLVAELEERYEEARRAAAVS